MIMLLLPVPGHFDFSECNVASSCVSYRLYIQTNTCIDTISKRVFVGTTYTQTHAQFNQLQLFVSFFFCFAGK